MGRWVTAAFLLTLTLLLLFPWSTPSNDLDLKTFDAGLLQPNPHGSLPNDGRVNIQPRELGIEATANSNPTLTLLTTEAPAFTQTFQANVSTADGDAYPLELRLWNPNQDVAAELWWYQGVVYGGLHRGSKWLSTSQVGTFVVHQPLLVTIDRRPCGVGLSVTDAAHVVRALTATCADFPELFQQDTLSVTVSALANVGATSSVVLSAPHLTVDHQTLYGYPADDTRLRWIALITLALACVIAVPSVARSLWRLLQAARWPTKHRLALNLALYVSLAALLVAAMAQLGGHPYDAYSQGAWAYIADHYGASRFYSVGLITAEGQAHGGDPYQTLGFAYPPLLILLYQALGHAAAWLAPGFTAFDPRLDLIIKGAHIVFLMGGGLAIALLIPGTRRRYLIPPVLAGSVALLIDAGLWGQLDAELVVLLALGSIALFRGWLGTGLALLAIACLTKQTGLLFAPWAVLIASFTFGMRALVRAVPRALAAVAIPLCALFAAGLHPASTWVPSIHKALQWSTVAFREEATSLVTNDAYGLWPLLTGRAGYSGVARMTVPDVTRLAGTGISYLTLSHAMAVAAGAGLLVVMFRTPIHRWTSQPDLPFLALAAAGLIEPLVLTRMTGRYFLPGLVFLMVALAIRATPWLLAAAVGLDALLGFELLGLLTDIAREHPALVPHLDPAANPILGLIWSIRHSNIAVTAFSTLVCLIVLGVVVVFVWRAVGGRTAVPAVIRRASRLTFGMRTAPMILLVIPLASMWLINTSVVGRVSSGEFALTSGFYVSEDLDSTFPAWTGGHGVVELNFKPSASRASVSIDLAQPHFDGSQANLQLKLLFDNLELPKSSWRVSEIERGQYRIAVPLPDGRDGMHRLELISPTFIPKDHQPGNDDKRQLGVQVRGMTASNGIGNLTLVRVPPAPTLTGHDPEPVGLAATTAGASRQAPAPVIGNNDLALWSDPDAKGYGQAPLGWSISSTGTFPDVTRTSPVAGNGALFDVQRGARDGSPDWEEASLVRTLPLQQCRDLRVKVAAWPDLRTSNGGFPLVAAGVQLFSEAAPGRTLWVAFSQKSREYQLSPTTGIWAVQPSSADDVDVDLNRAAAALGASGAPSINAKLFLAVHRDAPGNYQMRVNSIACR